MAAVQRLPIHRHSADHILLGLMGILSLFKVILKIEFRTFHYLSRIDASKQIRPQGYKTFFMLNSAEHGVLNAH